jgi:hypothetical protein
MKPGDKVVCINDTFTSVVRVLYKQLPVKGDISFWIKLLSTFTPEIRARLEPLLRDRLWEKDLQAAMAEEWDY